MELLTRVPPSSFTWPLHNLESMPAGFQEVFQVPEVDVGDLVTPASKVKQHQSPHIILVKANYRASPNSRREEIDLPLNGNSDKEFVAVFNLPQQPMFLM